MALPANSRGKPRFLLVGGFLLALVVSVTIVLVAQTSGNGANQPAGSSAESETTSEARQPASEGPTLGDREFIPGDGSYVVGDEMKTGVWATVAETVTDCYWELSDAQGNTLQNDFITFAENVFVPIGEGSYGFTTRGCGTWVWLDV